MKRRARSQQFVITDTTGFWGRPAASLLLVFISLVLMTVSVARPGMVEGAKTGFADAMLPLLSIVSQPVQDAAFIVRDISGLAQMQSEIAALRQENTRLQGWYQKAMHLQAENESLRRLMNVKIDAPHKFVTARVVADAGNAYVKSLLIAAGSKDGVEKGQAVLSGKGLVGRVIEVGQNSSRVLLITDINSRVPVVVQGPGYYAVMAGTNEQRPQVDHLPADTLVEKYSPVMTSGHGGIFPAGLPVGQVIPPANDAPKSAKHEIQLYADFEAMPFVRVVNIKIDPNLKSGALK